MTTESTEKMPNLAGQWCGQTQPHGGTGSHGDAERAGEGCSCVPDGWHVVNPAYMSKLKRLEAEHE